jgi:hypothetical protein
MPPVEPAFEFEQINKHLSLLEGLIQNPSKLSPDQFGADAMREKIKEMEVIIEKQQVRIEILMRTLHQRDELIEQYQIEWPKER